MRFSNSKSVLILILVVMLTSVIVFLSRMKTKNVVQTPYNGVAVTNSWYSSLFFDQFSKPIFSYPGSYQLDSDGVKISRSTPDFSNISIAMPFNPDLFIKTTSGEKFISKKVENIGQWDIQISLLTASGKKLFIHIIKGSPVLYVKSDTDLSLTGTITKIDSSDTKFAVIKTQRNNYLVDLATASPKDNSLILHAATSFTPITILPDDAQAENYKIILECSQKQPTTTDYSFEFKSANKMDVNYSFSDDILRKSYLFTIWPHQQDLGTVNSNNKSLGTYKTARGDLKLVCSNTFSVSYDVSPLPLDWSQVVDKSKVGSEESKKLFNQDKTEVLSSQIPQGVYYKGKYIKNMVDLWDMANILGLKTEATELENEIKSNLLNEIDNFYFDDKTNLVISKNPEFGNELGNDHHFQYSYYIYSYAKLYNSFDAEDKKKIDNLMQMFQKEGMPLDKAIYPTNLRFLDVMEGHSWADGHGLFNDGNDQESSSEAAFYWYSWFVWGQKTNNQKISDWAKFAFYTETNGKMSYWFLVKNKSLSDNFKKPIISLVWGGKADYATWFSPDEDKVFGIQILPLNPSSLVSLKIPDKDSLERITKYYDNIVPKMKANSGSFVNLYLTFKKINGISVSSDDIQNGGEYVSKTLIYLLK